VLFLRAVAALSLAKGLYHWAMICGFGAGAGGGFEAQSSPWQIALIVGYVFIAFEATREQPE
jgi:hypothetical protein